MAIPIIQHQLCRVELSGAMQSQAPWIYSTVHNMIPPLVDRDWWTSAAALAIAIGAVENWWLSGTPISGAPSQHSAQWGTLHLP